MSSEALGGGVMVAVAAALWVAYLMPTWSRRREYLAVERNAVRLQQTMRILAETAEVPGPVRLEANARGVRTQQKILAEAEEAARLEAKAATDAARAARRLAAETAAAARAPIVVSPAVRLRRRRLRRLRTLRALSSLVLLTGIVLVVAGVLPVILTGSWLLLGVGGALAVAALLSLSRLARAARAARVARVAPVATAMAAQRFEPVHLEESAAPVQTWTPQPLPKPLYLSRGSIAQTAMASMDAAAELRKAAAEAELASRASELAARTAVTPIVRPAARAGAAGAAGAGAAGVGGSSAPSRFASMGIVGETEPGMTDLDAVLRRRRAVG